MALSETGGKRECLATELGYKSAAIITMWESGERKPPSDKLPELAKILGCSIDDLFS